jgi:PAS domain S-box-containing protein
MILNNLKIGPRLCIGYVLIFFLLILLTILGISRMHLLSQQTLNIYNHPLTVSNAVLRINTNIIKIHRSMKDVALAKDIADIKESSQIVDNFETEVFKDFEIIKERFLGEHEKYAKALEVFKAWKPIRDEVISLMIEDKGIEAADITKGKGAVHVVKIERTMEALSNFAQGKADEFLATAGDVRDNAIYMMYGLLVIALIACTALAVVSTRSITRPVETVRAATNEIGRGNLNAVIDIKSVDEIGQLATSFNKMTEELKLITASRDELNKEVTERMIAEETLKWSEERYRKLTETAFEGIALTERGTFLEVSNNFAQLFGYDQSEMLGMHVSKIVSTDYLDDVLKKIETGYEKPYESVCIRKDGSHFPVEVCGKSVKHKGREVRISAIRDITARKKLEEEMLKSQKLESIGILAGGIAHDFNNILTGILGNINLSMMNVDAQSKVYKRLEEAEKASIRAKDLTQQLLTFSKGGEPIKKTMSIDKLLKESLGFFLSGSNVKCEYSIQDNLWPVYLDEGQMNQVFHNLLVNADQAMPEGGTIHIRCQNISVQAENGLSLNEGNYVRICIKDEGIGISEEYLQNIFDPYFTTKQKGSGLGLATVYSIVKKHRGTITVESGSDAGTTFHIYIPASSREIAVSDSVEQETIIGKRRILIMDDEQIVRDTAAEMLATVGCEAELAKDGNEAIELYKISMDSNHPFDAVILDLTVPSGLGGKDTVLKLRELDSEVKAIVSSGYSNDPVMADFKKYGFNGVIVKPYRPNDLNEILLKVIKSQ